MKKTIRAIYLGDMRFNECNVFELNLETNNFEMLNNNSFKFEREKVENSEEFIVVEILDDIITTKEDIELKI